MEYKKIDTQFKYSNQYMDRKSTIYRSVHQRFYKASKIKPS